MANSEYCLTVKQYKNNYYVDLTFTPYKIFYDVAPAERLCTLASSLTHTS